MTHCNYTVDEDGIAIIEINNPPMNAISTAVLMEIQEIVFSALEDKTVRVLIFTGAGKAFIAGADLKEIDDCITKEEALKYMKIGQGVMNIIDTADKPSIAAINGYALGGGLEFALSCHMRIADENAKMGFPEIKLGLIPGFGGTQRAPRLLGKAIAYELILTGEPIGAETALQYGVINKIAKPGEALSDAKILAKKIAQKGRPAVKAALDLIRKGLKMHIIEAQDLEREKFSVLCETENKREGVKAFLNKKEPKVLDH